jgi:putative acetyltransferase
MNLRPETASDFAAIRAINVAAFVNHPHSNQTEHLIVEWLREADALTLSLVAEVDGHVVGHIAFSPITVGGAELGWHTAGPLAVMPTHQRRGIGRVLLREGLARMQALGSKGIYLVGDPGYYLPQGFSLSTGLTLPGVPQQFALCKVFSGAEPVGEVGLHTAFLRAMAGGK